MDFLPIAVLILFVLVGGIIAVVADELGRRIGKKRLVLHKRIRPKHTARLVTFFSGMFITLITMGLIAISSAEMRTLLTRGRIAIRDAQAERDRLLNQNKTLAADIARLNGEVTSAESRRGAAEAKAASAEERAKAAADREKEINARLASSQKQLKSAQDSLRLARNDYAEAKSQLASVQGQLTALRRDLKAAKVNLAKVSGEYQYVYAEYTGLLEKNQELTIERNQLSKQLEDLEGQLQALGDDIRSKNDSISDLNRQQDELERNISNLEQAVARGKEELAKVEAQRRFFEGLANQAALHARFDSLMFPAGEELVRVPIPAGISKDQAKTRIELAIEDAKVVAKNRGAEPWAGLDYAGMLEEDFKTNRKVPVATRKDMLAAELAGLPEDEVLIVYAAMNSFLKESVAVDFVHKPNPVVYQQGQIIAEIRVDSRQPLGKIMESLNSLGDRIRIRALQDKMIPVQRGDKSLGTATAEDIFVLCNQIKESGGSVRVQARAKRLTRAADQLQLDFNLR